MRTLKCCRCDLPLMLKTLSPARWSLLQELSAEGPLSIYELAKRLDGTTRMCTPMSRSSPRWASSSARRRSVPVPWELLRAELRL